MTTIPQSQVPHAGQPTNWPAREAAHVSIVSSEYFLAGSTMIRRIPWLQPAFPAFALCALLTAPLRAADKPARWIGVNSDHISVLTDAGDRKGREVAVRFEQMRAVFGQLLTRNKVRMPEPLEVIALKDDKEYAKIAPLKDSRVITSSGFFIPGEDRNYIVLNLAAEESWRAVTHEFAHLLLNYNYPPVQPWFDEGFAEYFSSLRVDNQQVEIGFDPELGLARRTDPMGNQIRNDDPPRALAELLDRSVWLAFDDLLTMKQPAENFREGTHQTLFYAQSWITVHYLLHENKMPQTGVYFDLVENQNIPVDQAVRQAYGMTMAQFDQAVKGYFHSLAPLLEALNASPQATAPGAQVYFSHIPMPGDEIGTSMREIPSREGQAWLAEVAIRVPEHRDQAVGQLQALLADPKTESAIAYRALAWDHMQRQESAEAIEELNSALQIDSKDPWVRYELALQSYRSAQAHAGSFPGLANMMQDLQIVIDWDHDFAEAYNMLAVGRLAGGGAHSAMTAIRVAVRLSPRNQTYLLNLANIEISLKQWDTATALLERLQRSGNPPIAHLAKKDLADLPTLKKYGILPQEEGSPAGSDTASARSGPASAELPAAQEGDEASANSSPSSPRTVPDKRPPKFLKGNLLRVDCQSPVAILSILTGSRVVKLRTEDYKSLVMLGSEQFSCDWKHRQVSVNYKPGGKSDGDLISLEVQ
jgi:tetratricopeptide (TPR) repeat protein